MNLNDMRLDVFDDPMMARDFFDFVQKNEIEEAANMTDYMSKHDSDIILAMLIAVAAKRSQTPKN